MAVVGRQEVQDFGLAIVAVAVTINGSPSAVRNGFFSPEAAPVAAPTSSAISRSAKERLPMLGSLAQRIIVPL